MESSILLTSLRHHVPISALLVLLTAVELQCELINSYKSPRPSQTGSLGEGDQQSQGIFRGLTLNEFVEVREFVFQQKHLHVEPSASATLNSNYIFLIEDMLPNKSRILELRNQSKPVSDSVRKAKVVLFMGAEKPKTVREFSVYPIPSPRVIQPLGEAISWKSRPLCPLVENVAINSFIERALIPLKQMLYKSFGQWVGGGCKTFNQSSRCLFIETLPRASPTSDDRQLQIQFYLSPESVDGFYLYPLPFMLIIYTPNNRDQFSVRYVYYNDVRFSSIQSLKDAYNKGIVSKINLTQYGKYANVYGSPLRRGPPTVLLGKRPPQMHYPDGPRFEIIGGRHVDYLGWSFDLYFRTISGLQLFNVKYMGVDVAFEVGMQTVAVLYGTSESENIFRSYYDDGFVLGALNFPLMRGIDCPTDAAYLDSIIYSPGYDKAQIMRDACCIFEHVNSVPLRRHYEDGKQFSMQDAILVVRQVLTVSNYDYIFDYEFHQTGVVETKVSSTGYVAASNNREMRYGFLLNRDQQVNGNMHVHAFNFKFDLDVTTTTNRLVSIDFEAEDTSSILCTNNWQQLRIQEYLIQTEKEAASHYTLAKPKYFVLQSPSLNFQGYRRSYRVLSNNFMQLPIRDRSPFVNASSWIKYGLVVTVHKDDELTTASLYTQGDPFNSRVDIERFLADNEGIVDQDLVVWATVVMHHIPSAEDIPVTTTSGKTLSVLLAPFNFFDEDPSMTSDDAVVTYSIGNQ